MGSACRPGNQRYRAAAAGAAAGVGRQAEVAGGMGGQYPAARTQRGADRETGAGETAEPGDGQAAADVTGL